MIPENSPINQTDIERFFGMVEKNIGVAMDLDKAYLIQSRLSRVVAQHKFTDYAALLRFLISNPIGEIHVEAFEAMTTQETSFFRDPRLFEVLKTRVFTNLIRKRKDSRELNIWSAASSTGQEPYSIAILLREHFPDLAAWKIRILATDVSERALERASLGIYNGTEIQRGLSELQIQKHFSKMHNGLFEINCYLRSMVQFKKINLIDDWPFMPKFDLVLMRNVLLYFNASTKAKILNQLYRQLLDVSSYFIIGSSESVRFDQSYQLEQLDGVSVYHKKIYQA